MVGQVANFNDLFALQTKSKDRTGVDVMHIEKVLLGKSWVVFAAKIAVLIIDFNFIVFGNLDELIFDSLNLILIS